MRKEPRSVLHAFFDESGDEGIGGKSSPWLCVGGWILPESQLQSIKKYLVDGAGKVWRGNKPPAHIHFQQIGSHSKRKALLKMLCGLNFTVVMTAAHKQSFRTREHLKCPTLFNYMAKHLLERASWFAKESQQKINVTFASRAENSWLLFKQYIDLLKNRNDHQIKFDYIQSIGNIPANVNSLVQASDWITSGVANGLNPDEFRAVETGYTEILWGKFWMKNAKLWSYGLKILPSGFERKNEELFRKIDTWLEDPASIFQCQLPEAP